VSQREATAALSRLEGIVERLLGPGGCPWDRGQTLETLKSYLLEETYEVLEAIDEGDPAHHREELGDLLFQVVFQAALRARQGAFTLADVVAGIAEKLVRRHPHVFGHEHARDAQAVRERWEAIKREETLETKGRRRRTLEGVPGALPALLRGQRLQQKAAGVGFDWDGPAGARAKVTEELEELDEAAARGDRASVFHEVGDLLEAVTNWARLLGVDAEDALRAANRRFESRFGHIEDRLWAQGRSPEDAGLAELESYWQEAKDMETRQE